jgi:glycosyltransferase involved in cell wall biosynthesis
VVFNGINIKEYSRATETDAKRVREKYDLKNPYFLYIGVWRDHKNMPRMLKAYSQALQSGLEVDMVIAGREDPVYREVRDTIVAENLQKHVRILGFVDDDQLAALYRDARAYVLPSLYEGFGLQILESMAAGIPVISSNVSSMPEIAGKEGALFFHPTSIESIKKAMIEIDSDEELRKKLIEFGKKRVQDFSWEKMGKETLKIYKDCLKIDPKSLT